MPAKTSTHVEATETFSGDLDGAPIVIRKEMVISADDPVAKAFPQYFQPLSPRRSRPEVEQATAAPGEKRGAKKA